MRFKREPGSAALRHEEGRFLYIYLLKKGNESLHPQRKVQMKREALEKNNRQTNEMPLNGSVDFGTMVIQ